MSEKIYCTFLVFCFFSGLCIAAEEMDPIQVYDLRYTLDIDTSSEEQVSDAWDHCHAVATVQGIVNRDKARFYVLYVQSQHLPICIDEYWLDKFRQPDEWLAKREIEKIETIENLIEKFRDQIDGAVVYDPNVPATSNLASTVAGVKNLVAVRYDNSPSSLYGKIIKSGPQLPVKVWLVNPDGSSIFTGTGLIPDTSLKSTGSAKCDVYLWLKENLMDKGLCNTAYGAYYIDYWWTNKPAATILNHHNLSNHDFFVAKKAFFFDLSPWADEPATDDVNQPLGTDVETMKKLLLSAWQQGGEEGMTHIGGFPPWAFKYTKHAGGKHDDVPAEWEYTKIISAYNGYQDADAIGYGAMANASFWMHFPLKSEYPQKWVTREQLNVRGNLSEDGKVDLKGRNFIIFYVGDYDSSSWVYQRMPDIWDNADRGKLPMMWAVSPVIDRRAAMAMHYMRESASPNDYFVAADNGAGYLNPSMLQGPRDISNLPQGLDAWQKHCEHLYKKWGLTVTGFIIDGYANKMNEEAIKCYSVFSPNGIVPQKAPIASLYNRMPILKSDYDVNHDPPAAAEIIVQRVRERDFPFHWFRNILKSPSWYVEVKAELDRRDPTIELLDAPAFFELLRIYLEDNPQYQN